MNAWKSSSDKDFIHACNFLFIDNEFNSVKHSLYWSDWVYEVSEWDESEFLAESQEMKWETEWKIVKLFLWFLLSNQW